MVVALGFLCCVRAVGGRQCQRVQQFTCAPAEVTLPCDLDHFALSIRRHVGSQPERLLEKDVLNAIKHASLHARSTTLVVESRHARRRAFREMRHQIRSHTLSCAEYMLRECARLYSEDLRRHGFASRHSRRLRRVLQAKKHGKKRLVLTYLNKKSAAYIRQHGRCTRQRLDELKASWLTEWRGFDRQEQLVLGSPGKFPVAATADELVACMPCQRQGVAQLALPAGCLPSCIGHFRYGSCELPMRPGQLECFISDYRPALGPDLDAAGGTASLIRQLAPRVFPQADPELEGTYGMPAHPKSEVGSHLSCDQAHYGFCRIRHHEHRACIYNVNDHLTVLAQQCRQRPMPDRLRHTCMLLDAGADVGSVCLLYCCSLRLVTCQQNVHLFFECTPPSAEDEPGHQTARVRYDDAGAAVLMTTWMVAVRVRHATSIKAKCLTYEVRDRLDTMQITGEVVSQLDWVVDAAPKVRARRPAAGAQPEWQALEALSRRRPRRQQRQRLGGAGAPPLASPDAGQGPAALQDAPACVAQNVVADQADFFARHLQERGLQEAARFVPAPSLVPLPPPEPQQACPEEDDDDDSSAFDSSDACVEHDHEQLRQPGELQPQPRTPEGAAESVAAVSAGPAVAQAPPQAYVRYQDREGKGYVRVDGKDAPVGRITEWPQKPTSVGAKCTLHGKTCRGTWPKRRAPSFDILVDWLQKGPGLTLQEHLQCLPA